LRNPYYASEKDWVVLNKYEKYASYLLGKERFSNWFNTNESGALCFKMQNSPLLKGQLIARGAF